MKQLKQLKQLKPSKTSKASILLLLALFMLFGCASKIPHRLASDYTKMGMRLIAVMPIKNHTADAKAARMLREKVINELYFKGYPKILPGVIDEKLSSVYGSTTDFTKGNVPPGVVGDLLGVDAVLYCTLTQCKTSYAFIYASTSVSIIFELRNVKTGETLWSTSYDTVKRSYGVSKKQLEMESNQVYEVVIQEVLDKVMETLPNGPDI